VIDAGVVVGLVLGLLSLGYHWLLADAKRKLPVTALDLP
jgi:hypothetical protein